MKIANRTAFTLVEVLLIVVIVAALATLFVPYFQKQRQKSRTITCLTNQKQLSLAMLQYLQDNDQRYPIGLTKGRQESPQGWSAEVYPYNKSAQTFCCPDETEECRRSTGPSVVSYALNANLVPKFGKPLRDTDLNSPAMTVLFVEVTGTKSILTSTKLKSGYSDAVADGLTTPNNAGKVMGTSNGTLASGTLGQGNNRGIPNVARHGDGSTFSFADGHCYWLRPESISPGRTAKTANSPATSTTAEGTSANGHPYQGTFSPY